MGSEAAPYGLLLQNDLQVATYGFAYREVGTRGGVPKTEFVNLLSNTYASTADGGIEDCIQAMEEHPVMDAYWQDKIADLEQIEIPAYIVASYTNTIHTLGTFEGYTTENVVN